MEEQKYLKRKRKAQAEGNKALLTSVCIDLATLYFREARYEAAIREYKHVAEIYKEQELSMDYAKANRMIGEAYTHLRQFNKALKHQEIHLAVAKEQGDKLEQQRALATIGHTYLTTYLDTTDNPDKTALGLATKAFMKSLNICESLTGISKTEHMDMMSRLFGNLGVVQECQGNYEKGIELVNRSINICKTNDIYEQLERGYFFLASLYTKKEDYSNAIHYYNLAIDVAGRLDDKITLMCGSLNAKAEILIKLADFHGAKNILLKAYKLKNPNKIERDSTEHNLKVVSAMCYTEDTLLVTKDSDYENKKKLYERMGDGACDLKNYPKALEYYTKMLEASERNGDCGKELSACYISLAQTYKDNKQFDLAIEFFKKDYELCRTNVKESINTLFSILDCMEASGKSLDEIILVIDEVRANCREFGEKHLEGKVLSRYVSVLRKFGKVDEADMRSKELEDLEYCPSSESESEGLDEQVTQNIGDDIDLDNITDVSDGSDTEKDLTKTRTKRQRATGFAIKKNNKGETQLHTACISGNVNLVKRLLDQGHPVNIRDNCGWLPIHEACICGHIDIVRMLVQKGAAINDRGGTLCNGMTPLHDAASNGHLEVIEYMLDNGASAVSKTDEGETPLHILRRYRQGVQLDPIEQSYYETILKRMSEALEKTGQSDFDENLVNKENKALIALVDEEEVGSIDEYSVSDENSLDATDQYKNIMESLRTNNTNQEVVRKKRPMGLKRSALLEPNEVGEDWLDDDLGSSMKKRKVINRSSSSQSFGKVNSKENLNEEFATQRLSMNRNKRKSQSTLIKAGFIRKLSASPTQSLKERTPSPLVFSSQCKSNSLVEPDSTTDFLNTTVPLSQIDLNPTKIKQMLSVDVRIEGKLFRIPIPVSELESLTMKWLADEATKRFYKKEAMKPTIELETKNGAMLCEDDLISVLFPVGGTQGEEVQAKVVKWNIPPIAERYKDASYALNMEPHQRLLDLIETATSTISLENENLTDKLIPLCKAINRQTSLYELNLTGNFMPSKCIELLAESFSTLDNLTILNLSLNGITAQSLVHISTVLKESQDSLLKNLVCLDLSYNPLTNESFKYLSVITKSLKLRTLRLVGVDFTKSMFQAYYNKNLEMDLEFLETLDLSYNELDKESICRFFRWMQPLNLKILNVGNNMVDEDGLGMELARFLRKNDLGFPNLRTLNLSRCQITDDEIYELLRLLISANNFEDLDLSYNKITSISLKRLIENSVLTNLNVCCCDKILENFGTYSSNLKLSCNSAGKKCKSIQTSLDYVENYAECEKLIEMWRLEYNERAVVEGLEDGILHLHVMDSTM